ncbi:hypothetical protein KP509_11G029100 [Ceratopteris richardii]|uniref:Uncharacterized protein n=1 Tax=Ceratopteris richardii TaxID=49495 RepID=A0A8T2TU01_CERRI|nr:hypothetical protein KP509_11G029100 [Ceratopteris richardii]
MAHAARQRLTSVLRGHNLIAAPVSARSNPSRAFSASGHAAVEENAKEAKKWFRITVAGFAVVISLTIYNFVGGEHHEEHERPEYSYLHIRNKEFPWGPDGLFERKHHDH